MTRIGTLKHDTAEQIARSVPAIGGATIAGLTLNEVVAVATLAYIALQMGFLVWKWVREAKDEG